MAKYGPRLPTGSTEQDTVRAILQLLALHKIPSWRINTGATKIDKRFIRFGAVGMSDIIGIWPADDDWVGPHGGFLAIEVKSKTGVVTPAQHAFLDQVNAAGGKGFVARSLDDVKRELGL